MPWGPYFGTDFGSKMLKIDVTWLDTIWMPVYARGITVIYQHSPDGTSICFWPRTRELHRDADDGDGSRCFWSPVGMETGVEGLSWGWKRNIDIIIDTFYTNAVLLCLQWQKSICQQLFWFPRHTIHQFPHSGIISNMHSLNVDWNLYQQRWEELFAGTGGNGGHPLCEWVRMGRNL